eukprot:CAMPEP_0206037772 /NCGR_PEP_ID=MMETSP1466-20131121/3667_1 /ASSEMBLY_ACC=CAM_ASM_001126 /TAXON_ID=44452 /ORGANISM="Pavlova gyrans, Strain CCMP608" /LENGTH=31 /DNA_ID= /DNA_START= /DNA_END= /DNA_ORIENTATION=
MHELSFRIGFVREKIQDKGQMGGTPSSCQKP